MADYRVEIRPAALDFIRAQTPKHRRQIANKINSLALEPRPSTSKKLANSDDLWRVRAGDFRIIYTIEDSRLLVVVVTVGNRKDIYRRLENAGLL